MGNNKELELNTQCSQLTVLQAINESLPYHVDRLPSHNSFFNTRTSKSNGNWWCAMCWCLLYIHLCSNGIFFDSFCWIFFSPYHNFIIQQEHISLRTVCQLNGSLEVFGMVKSIHMARVRGRPMPNRAF